MEKAGVFAVGWGDAEVTSQRFCREFILWNSLSHPNVLKLVGVLGDIRWRQFATVSEWMAHGNIIEYIGKNATNRLDWCVSPRYGIISPPLNFGNGYMARHKD